MGREKVGLRGEDIEAAHSLLHRFFKYVYCIYWNEMII